MDFSILDILRHWGIWSYLFIFLLMFVEGTLTLIAVVFLVSQGVLTPFLALPLAVLGAFLEALLWYWIGARLGQSSVLSRWINRLTSPFDKHFNGRMLNTLIVSKFVYGLHRAVLARTGMLGIPRKRFMRLAMYTIGLWSIVVIGLGFGFAASYNSLRRYIKYAEVVILAILCLFIFFELYLSKRLKKYL